MMPDKGSADVSGKKSTLRMDNKEEKTWKHI